MSQKNALRNYLSEDIQDVGGWCNPRLWNCIEPLVDKMAEDGEIGDVAEIGVFKGKFLIGLAKTVPDNVLVHAIDVFADQDGNVDKAGVGSLDELKANVQKNGIAPERLKIYSADSSTIDHTIFKQNTETTRPVSLFSVDGCHTAEHTASDTLLAMAATKRNGLIFVDDYTNPMWPGVQEAIARMYICSSPVFVPLAVTCNKLILCHLANHDSYLQTLFTHLKQNYKSSKVKRVKRFGYLSLTVQPNAASTTFLVPDAEETELDIAV